MIRSQTQHQIREIKRIRGDQITEIENNKIEIILDQITLVQIKKTLITKIKIKILIEKNLEKIKKILKVKILNQNHRLERKLLTNKINKMRIKFKVNQ